MRDKIKQIARLISAAEIEYVRLVDVNARTRIRSPKDIGAASLQVRRPTTRVKERQKGGTFYVSAVIEARVVSPEQLQDPALSVRAEFELKYALPKGFKVSRRDLTTFAEVNSIFNVWPYWREFIQNLVVRMNLPAITLPLLRLGDLPKARAKDVPEAKGGEDRMIQAQAGKR